MDLMLNVPVEIVAQRNMIEPNFQFDCAYKLARSVLSSLFHHPLSDPFAPLMLATATDSNEQERYWQLQNTSCYVWTLFHYCLHPATYGVSSVSKCTLFWSSVCAPKERADDVAATRNAVKRSRISDLYLACHFSFLFFCMHWRETLETTDYCK